MKHQLVGPYKVCSYDALGGKAGPALGVKNWNIEGKKRKTLKFFFSESGRLRALICGTCMQHLLVDPYQVYSYDAPGVTILNIGTKIESFKILFF